MTTTWCTRCYRTARTVELSKGRGTTTDRVFGEHRSDFHRIAAGIRSSSIEQDLTERHSPFKRYLYRKSLVSSNRYRTVISCRVSARCRSRLWRVRTRVLIGTARTRFASVTLLVDWSAIVYAFFVSPLMFLYSTNILGINCRRRFSRSSFTRLSSPWTLSCRIMHYVRASFCRVRSVLSVQNVSYTLVRVYKTDKAIWKDCCPYRK